MSQSFHSLAAILPLSPLQKKRGDSRARGRVGGECAAKQRTIKQSGNLSSARCYEYAAARLSAYTGTSKANRTSARLIEGLAPRLTQAFRRSDAPRRRARRLLPYRSFGRYAETPPFAPASTLSLRSAASQLRAPTLFSSIQGVPRLSPRNAPHTGANAI